MANIIFLELFAGKGILSRAVIAAGIPSLPPNEFQSGRTDFRNKLSVEALQAKLLRFFNQKVATAWEEFRNERREQELATGIAVDWGNFTQETMQAEFENSKHYPQVFIHLALRARPSLEHGAGRNEHGCAHATSPPGFAPGHAK